MELELVLVQLSTALLRAFHFDTDVGVVGVDVVLAKAGDVATRL